LRISGIVLGVGFRPFVYSLASGLGLGGQVGNDVDGVFAVVEGEPEAIGKFMLAFRRRAAPRQDRADHFKAATAAAPAALAVTAPTAAGFANWSLTSAPE
jgi:hydrogenase maturation protein HypF